MSFNQGNFKQCKYTTTSSDNKYTSIRLQFIIRQEVYVLYTQKPFSKISTDLCILSFGIASSNSTLFTFLHRMLVWSYLGKTQDGPREKKFCIISRSIKITIIIIFLYLIMTAQTSHKSKDLSKISFTKINLTFS